MNIDEARKIFVEYYPILPIDMKKAVRFTLEHWNEIQDDPFEPAPVTFVVEDALNFLKNLPKLPTNARDEDKDFIKKLNFAVAALRNESAIWFSLNDLPHEQWRDVENYEGLYQGSNYGRIKSFHKEKIVIRKPVTLERGYQQVSLDKKGDRKCVNVHVLVAKLFLPNPESKPMVDHYDTNTANNCVWNLSWVTNGENQKHAIELGTKRSGCDSPRSDMEPEEIREIRRLYVKGSREFGTKALAKKFGKSRSTIKRIVSGKSYKNIV